jgi:prepilin-type N-terminal cleavage/methylation domain-containing protein
MRTTIPHSSGFTLIELSIVLVVIGLIIGGVLVGQDLIRAAGVRAQISQIEKYNTAVNTFRGKYDALPGDIANPAASNFGFLPRSGNAGEGDGNGIIEGVYQLGCAACNEGQSQSGESTMFWVDLSTAGLVEGGFTTATPDGSTQGVAIPLLFPAATIGGGNYIAVWSGGPVNSPPYPSNGLNYFTIIAATSIGGAYVAASTPGLSVNEAYSIDRKMDDGLPQSGNVTAMYDGNAPGAWGNWAGGATASNGPTTAATPGSGTTCYDNGSAAGATQQYSVEINGGSNVDCALSFQFQ